MTKSVSRGPDLLHGPVFSNMTRFFLPIMLGSLLQQLYSMVDAVVLGRLVVCGAGLRIASGLRRDGRGALRILIGEIGDEIFRPLDEQRVLIDLAAGRDAQDRISGRTGERGIRQPEVRQAEHERNIDHAVF